MFIPWLTHLAHPQHLTRLSLPLTSHRPARLCLHRCPPCWTALPAGRGRARSQPAWHSCSANGWCVDSSRNTCLQLGNLIPVSVSGNESKDSPSKSVLSIGNFCCPSLPIWWLHLSLKIKGRYSGRLVKMIKPLLHSPPWENRSFSWERGDSPRMGLTPRQPLAPSRSLMTHPWTRSGRTEQGPQPSARM